ncbi:transmembrane emp24 domain-containing protein 5-like [Branchiostoma floridae x Branchiostoma belcheri]
MAEPWKNRACRLGHFLLLLFVFLLPGVVSSTDYDYTFTLPPGQRECFYQEVKKETNFEVEYQVIDGGDLDVTFVLRSPKGVPLVTELRKSEGIHSIDAKEDGDYMFCFDNTFSRISEKMIFFDVLLDADTDNEDDDWMDFVSPEEELDIKLEDMKDSMDRVKEHLSKSRQIQNVLRVFESKDRSTQEHNFERVNFWSVIQLIIMVVTALLQVYTVRHLFDDKKKVRT